MNPEDEAEEDGANIDLDSQRKGKCVVLKTSTRQVSHLALLVEYKQGSNGGTVMLLN
jgi:26S proteasome regulatory subunit T5